MSGAYPIRNCHYTVRRMRFHSLSREQLSSRPAWNPYLERRRLQLLASSYQSSWNVAAPREQPWGGPPEEPCVS